MKDLQNLRRVAEKVPNSRAIRLGDIDVFALPMGLFTRYDFVACDKLTTGLRHELFRVNQTYNSLTTLKSCRRPVVSLSHATKSCRVNRPYESPYVSFNTSH